MSRPKCDECGNPYHRGQSTQRFCSEPCRRDAFNRRRRKQPTPPGLCPVLAARLAELLEAEQCGQRPRSCVPGLDL